MYIYIIKHLYKKKKSFCNKLLRFFILIHVPQINDIFTRNRPRFLKGTVVCEFHRYENALHLSKSFAGDKFLIVYHYFYCYLIGTKPLYISFLANYYWQKSHNSLSVNLCWTLILMYILLLYIEYILLHNILYTPFVIE